MVSRGRTRVLILSFGPCPRRHFDPSEAGFDVLLARVRPREFSRRKLFPVSSVNNPVNDLAYGMICTQGYRVKNWLAPLIREEEANKMYFSQGCIAAQTIGLRFASDG